VRLNRVETMLMNNPVRAAIQRHFEARRLLAMGGPLSGGSALEVGCGRGVGVELILDLFGASRVDAFDLDPRMVQRARRRLARRGDRVRLWTGDVTQIDAPADAYDAVFDFGIIHHVPRWRDALREIGRVLKPGGSLYLEEVLQPVLAHAVTRRLLKHPEEDRFDAAAFRAGLVEAGLAVRAARGMGGAFAWFVADKPGASDH
jgi:ubiquinone/menaquinone biosynthesis C-methylase UbiE